MKKLIILVALCGIFLQSQAQNYEVSTKVYSVYDSLSTAIDTLSRVDTISTNALSNRMDNTFAWWYQIVVTCDSTFLVSTRSDFATGSTFLIKAGESWTSPKYSLDIVNLYMKVNGVGKALRRLHLFGN